MNKKELAEIKRRFDPKKGNIPGIHGCYVTSKGEILSVFDTPMISISEDDATKYMALFKRVLSGTPGQTGIDIVFSPEQVMSSEQHQLLMNLRDSALKDADLVNMLYQTIIDAIHMEENYLILLMNDTYDVPHRAKDAQRVLDDTQNETVFSYFVCCICPVKLSKPVLSYWAHENEFHSSEPEWLVGAPEAGFMFPAFDDRTSNIYNALYYVRDPEMAHEELTDALFHTELPMPAPAQKETFQAILKDTLTEDLNLEVMQAVHEQIAEKIEQTKEDKKAEAPIVSAPEVRSILEASGVPSEKAEAFEQKFEEQFGRGTTLSAANIVNPKQFEVRTPSVVIHVAPDCGDMLETRLINGKKYILIRAEEGVEVNGVNVNIASEEN